MKTTLVASAACVLVFGVAYTQDLSRVYTNPEIPHAKVLDRLNLKLGWRTVVPTESSRDGIFSIHLLGDQLLVQKRSGMIVALNAETGATLWRNAVGIPFRVTTALGYNNRSIFAISGIRLFSLDRATGALQWEFTLPHAAAAPPAADDDHIYLPMANRRLYVYELPRTAPSPGARPPAFGEPVPVYATAEEIARDPLLFLGDFEVGGFLEQRPLVTPTLVAVADTFGNIVGFPKGQGNESYRFHSGKQITAPMAQYSNMAYAASDDFDVFAIDMLDGRLKWRMTADRQITRKPSVTDEDIYISPQRVGLYRVDRATGQEIWRNPDAYSFLAHNKLLVYALDRFGGMLILDRARGTELSCLYMGDFVVPVANDQTDRIYLAANNGLIICLHDRDYPKPMRVREGEYGKPDAKPKPQPDAQPNSDKPTPEP